MKTVFDYITELKQLGMWEAQKVLYARAATLEWYYNMYFYLQLYCIGNKRRHLQEAIKSDFIYERIGIYDLEYWKKAIKTMEKVVSK